MRWSYDHPKTDHPASRLLPCLVVAATISLLPETTPALAQDVGDVQRGLVYAERVCAACHAVHAGETRSINPNATPFAVMARVPGVNARALSVFLQTPHATMPNLVVVGDDRDDLIAYVLSLRPQP